jgi:hypothetical protein
VFGGRDFEATEWAGAIDEEIMTRRRKGANEGSEESLMRVEKNYYTVENGKERMKESGRRHVAVSMQVRCRNRLGRRMGH